MSCQRYDNLDPLDKILLLYNVGLILDISDVSGEQCNLMKLI